MDLPEETIKWLEISEPGLYEQQFAALKGDIKFAYYTASETAVKIISNSELWLRNANLMNDFSEIAYGINMIRLAVKEDVGKKFREAIDSVYVGTAEAILSKLIDWENIWRFDTYIACVSQHLNTEDMHGRLSMWRSYGDIAIVINNTPFSSTDSRSGVFSTPVRYWSEDDFLKHLAQVTSNIRNNVKYIQSKYNSDFFLELLFQKFQLIALSTKHPGFGEELEWRVFHSRQRQSTSVLRKELFVVDGVAQHVMVLPLRDDPEAGLSAGMATILDRIIIGPTQFPTVTRIAYIDLLKQAGIETPETKIVNSDIPLRTK